jgi:UDP-N-acetylmuramyl pentapeptide phosphotransferase/UDP-N-acetylglucosamine-1-phosphate transferase
MVTLIVALLASLVCTMIIVRSSRRWSRRAADRDFLKPQKFHAKAVPRIGGVGIVLGISVAVVPLTAALGPDAAVFAALLLACALPVFCVGIAHDLSDAWPPRARLAAAAASAAMAYGLLDAGVVRTDIPGLDWIVSAGIGSLAVTMLSVTGIAHAVNIIDGFNGLASMCAALMLVAVCYVAFQVDDRTVALLALAGIGAIFGFFVWNFPAGLIFLGDGGAYFLGFYVAEVCVLLLARNPEVSPLFALLVCIYPIFETLFSIYRRWFLRAQPASMPDGIHLHSLIYRRVLRWTAGGTSVRARTRRNSMTSPYLWMLCMASVVPAMLFWDSTAMLTPLLGLFAVTYIFLYRRIVRFRSPRWLRLGSRVLRKLRLGDNER